MKVIWIVKISLVVFLFAGFNVYAQHHVTADVDDRNIDLSQTGDEDDGSGGEHHHDPNDPLNTIYNGGGSTSGGSNDGGESEKEESSSETEGSPSLNCTSAPNIHEPDMNAFTQQYIMGRYIKEIKYDCVNAVAPRVGAECCIEISDCRGNRSSYQVQLDLESEVSAEKQLNQLNVVAGYMQCSRPF